MNRNGKMKRVTDPLDDKAKARIIGAGAGADLRELGYLSSGSEHSADAGNDFVSESASFSSLVFGFPEDTTAENQAPENDSDSDEDFPPVNFQSDIDLYRNILLSHVNKALEIYMFLRSNKSVLRRNVMTYLRELGYNAAICKAKWESSGGLTSGSYEYIDVLRSDESSDRRTRYLVDLEFTSQFEIARPTKAYERVLNSLPEVFVGKSEELRMILRTMSEAVKRSLKVRGLLIPPWRKHRFMQNKWLGPYKRTTNPVSTNNPALPPLKQLPAVKCRCVGFNDASVSGGLWLPAVTRTR